MKLIDDAARIAPAGGAALELLSEDGRDLVYEVVSGSAAGMVGQRVAVDRSLSGLAVRSGAVQVCIDSERDPRVDAAACRAVGLRSMAIAPLSAGGRPFGVLKAISARPYAFGDQEVARLEAIAAELAAGL